MKIYENLNLENIDGEILKKIYNYNDYLISNFGRIKSFKQEKINGKILQQSKDSKGYFYIHLFKNNKSNNERIHILLYETFNDYKLKSYECIHHLDDNKENNIFNNLELMTKLEHNKLHNIGKNNPMFGIKRFGDSNPNSILTKQNILEIRKLSDEGISQRKIAKKFGVSQTQISRIKNGKSWKHIYNE